MTFGPGDPPSSHETLLAALKPFVPIPGFLIVLPAIYFFFRKTWRELDQDAQEHRGRILAEGKQDLRPFVSLVLCGIVLTIQEYYGGRGYFDTVIMPKLTAYDLEHHDALRTFKYNELYGFGWWVTTRVLGYVVVPFPLWKAIFRKDSLLDLGLRAKGFFDHIWIYGLFLGVVLPAMWVVSHQDDFGSYYPFYKQSSRSWFDFLLWESMYFLQFFALEMFFRGFWLGVLRKSLGSGAIFAMAVPYCMIHYGKPYLEANGAIIAGIALGSLSMKTKSIYQGFLVHITVAGLMDWLALSHRNALPHTFWPADVDPATGVAIPQREISPSTVVFWVVLVLGTLIVSLTAWRVFVWYRARRAARAQNSPAAAELP